MSDTVRMSVGTLTVLRVRPPGLVDRGVAGRAMALAPLVGLVLGAVAAGVGAIADVLGLGPLACAVIVIGTLALLTRALHLDGLADTADGLGSARAGAEGIAIMRRSDIGPFGVVTLVLVLLLQVVLLAQLWAVGHGHGPASVIVAVVASRAALPVLCSHGIPAATEGGLGAAVAQTVRGATLTITLLLTTSVVAVVGAIDRHGSGALTAVLALLVAVVAAAIAAGVCVRRFGGITGDVLGFAVELAFTAALFVLV